ncbi:MAG TPA: hypothetical protein VGK08_04345 [Thermoanaerobaculia bacterium]
MPWWESWFGEEYLDLYPHRDLSSLIALARKPGQDGIAGQTR